MRHFTFFSLFFALLTLACSESAETSEFSFRVLFDDGYVSNSDIHAFPTTWFLDTTGKKAFEKKGWSEKLLEEFSWRIEEVK